MPQQSTAVSQWPTAERHVSFTKARKSRKWPWPSEAVQVVRCRGRHSWEVRPALRVRQSPAHTVPGRLAVEHPRLAHEKDRRGRQAGPKSPMSSPSPRHPWDCPNLPVPSRVAGRTQHSSPTGNEREDSKGVVSTATTTSRKVSELSPPTRSAAESAGQADER